MLPLVDWDTPLVVEAVRFHSTIILNTWRSPPVCAVRTPLVCMIREMVIGVRAGTFRYSEKKSKQSISRSHTHTRHTYTDADGRRSRFRQGNPYFIEPRVGVCAYDCITPHAQRSVSDDIFFQRPTTLCSVYWKGQHAFYCDGCVRVQWLTSNYRTHNIEGRFVLSR